MQLLCRPSKKQARTGLVVVSAKQEARTGLPLDFITRRLEVVLFRSTLSSPISFLQRTLADRNRSSLSLYTSLPPPQLPATMPEKVGSGQKSKRRILRKCFAVLFIFNFIILLALLITWAILQPKKPRFTLQEATFFTLNVSATNLVSAAIQLTVKAHNPNSRVGIYYDKVDVYSTYRNQQITNYTGIPPFYQGHKDDNIWSPFIYGNNAPVAPYNGLALSQDQWNGDVRLIIKIDGRVKWKVGSFVSRQYHIHIACPAHILLDYTNKTGVLIGNKTMYDLSQSCSVYV
ncbi:NDR1/HIN1-like protein 1 [Sesamum angolense]|uniref:NDR1/HIN1-like protein 1 n=1 Tax=Sesamum angolense TaxID=2727404 RepID=A0AAE1WNV5_9LAMI|nr:NDR1/HIN1-like protein 1 [Sesamum angolense]